MRANVARDPLPLIVEQYGYADVCDRGPVGVCGVKSFLYTGGLCVGVTRDGFYEGRYCYATIAAARAALLAWDGRGDPPGLWIKYKSCSEDRLGPGATR